MQSEIPVLGERDVSRIQAFCKIAKMKNAPISLSELLALTSLDMSENELAQAWKNSNVLNEKFVITSSGVVIQNRQTVNEVQNERKERAERASSNIAWAEKFCDFLNDKWLRTLAISGSTSYLSAARDDDLDLFYIAEKDTLWIGFTRALLKARFFRLKQKNAPWICLSYVADEDFVEKEIAGNRNPIIARDALAAKVVRGSSYYNELLRRNEWMSRYFPKLYERRIEHHISSKHEPDSRSAFEVMGKKFVNAAFFYSVGSYIRIKSGLLNRKLKKTGRESAVFKLRIGKDHCIYESKSYREMKQIYSEL